MSNTDTQTSSTVIGQASLPQAAFALEPSSASPAVDCSNPSTGPRTETGKAVSARNAVKHNLCSQRLTGTDLNQLNAIRAKLDDEWEPSTETERMLLDQMALSQWRMDRALSLELHAFDDTHIDPQLLALALRYRTTAERSFYKALAELQRLRKTMREDSNRDEQAQEAAMHSEMERLCFAPIAGAPQFVSQNTLGAHSVRPQPDYDGLKAFLDSKIGNAAAEDAPSPCQN
jgi:hypothetical protein